MPGSSVLVCEPPKGAAWRFFAAVVFAVVVAAAQAAAVGDTPSYVTRNWRVDDGLPHNTVNRLVRDPRGFLWIATPGGLARFDGIRFDEYPVPGSLRDGRYSVRDVAVEDKRTLVVLPAMGGILRLRDGEFGEHPASSAVADRQLVGVYCEPGGVLWLATTADAVLRWENGTLKEFGAADGIEKRGHRVSFARDGRGRTWVAAGTFLGFFENGALVRRRGIDGIALSIAPARSGGLWIATGRELLKMDDEQVRTIVGEQVWSEKIAGLQDMTEAPDGSLWIASRRNGLARVGQGGLVSVRASHEQTSAVLADDEGNLWVGTMGVGLDRLRPRVFVRVDETSGLTDKISSSVADDAQGRLWLANRRGGLVRLDAAGAHEFRAPGADRNFFANVVCPAADGSIWLGAEQGVFRLAPEAGAELQQVSAELRNVHVLFAAQNGDLWVGAGESGLGFFRGGNFTALTRSDGYNGRRVKAVAQGSRGAIYVATDDRQIFEYDEGRLRVLISKESMPGGLIFSMWVDDEDSLWIATSNGVVLSRGGAVHHFTTAQGLPDNIISQVLSDDRGRMWFGGRRGIFSVERAELVGVAEGRLSSVNPASLGRDEGLFGASALDSTQPMSWKARDGRLWFATFEGVVGIDPAASFPVIPPPRVFIDRVWIDGTRAKPAGGVVRLEPGSLQVAFEFVALNFSAPEKTRVRHQLDGYDVGWVETGRDRRAFYSHLPPGEYTLRVTAANPEGEWNSSPATLTLIVVPSWWRTWWARAAAAAVFTLAVAGLARVLTSRRLRRRLERLEREQALSRERARIARDLHDELGGRLTQIGMLAERARRQSSEPASQPVLHQIAWHARRVAGDLESIVWTVSPANNTWDRLALFIDSYARDFSRDADLSCTVSGAEGIPAVPLAPEVQHNVLSVAKETLNNILKHARASQINVHMGEVDGCFELRIRDDGVGFVPADPRHRERNGLKNMRARIADTGGSIDIRSEPGRGAEICVRQPMNAFHSTAPSH